MYSASLPAAAVAAVGAAAQVLIPIAAQLGARVEAVATPGTGWEDLGVLAPIIPIQPNLGGRARPGSQVLE